MTGADLLTEHDDELSESGLNDDLLSGVRQVRRTFLSAIERHRPELFAYCRGLTGNIWDAEDLVQDTLAKALARSAETHTAISNPMGWLVRIATNTFVDSTRRARTVPMSDLDPVAEPTADPAIVRDALKEMITVLPPQERAVVVLKDVFDYPLDEIASLVGTSTGAVKSALHRGRATLSTEDRSRRLATRPSPDRAVLAAVAEAFTAYDVDRLLSLFKADAVVDLVGMVHEVGHQQIREGSLQYTFDDTGVRYSAEVRDFEGEPLVTVWSRPAEGDGPTSITEVWRCTTVDGLVAHVSNYFFAPEVMTEVTHSWDLPAAVNGYYYD